MATRYWLSIVLTLLGHACLRGAEPLDLRHVRTILSRQQEALHSLQIRLRRTTSISDSAWEVTSDEHAHWRPKFAGTDEIMEAFKFDKRYIRRLELERVPAPTEGASKVGEPAQQHFVDEAKAWNGKEVLLRKRERQRGPFVYEKVSRTTARDYFPASSYLSSAGWASTDPTNASQARRNLQRMGRLSELIQHQPYSIVVAAANIDQASSIALKGAYECLLPAGRAGASMVAVSDQLWLDTKHAFALRRREQRVGSLLIRTINDDFVEVLPNLFLPRRSRAEFWPLDGEGTQASTEPAWVSEMELQHWVTDHLADDAFDYVLEQPSKPLPWFKRVSAVHITTGAPAGSGKGTREELWVSKGVGRRVERYRHDELQMIVTDTPRWHVTWYPERNKATATPSRRLEPVMYGSARVRTRKEIVCGLERGTTAAFTSKRVRVNGVSVEMVVAHTPAEPVGGDEMSPNTHRFNPRLHRAVSGTEFRKRIYYFYPDTGLMAGFRCGCLGVSGDLTWLEYPSSSDVPSELFRLNLPDGADLEVIDPALGRLLVSKGK